MYSTHSLAALMPVDYEYEDLKGATLLTKGIIANAREFD